MNHSQKAVLAHGILASLAFVLLFPMGAILIRLGSFRGAWLIHAIFQLVAYIVYTAAFGLGVWMVQNLPINLLTHAHPIIGILVFTLLFFQPLLGFIHHVQFKKHARRTVWSHAHVWLINGGLGLLLASDAPAFTGFRPDQRQIAAYAVVAAFMWLLWVVAAVVGERRRSREARRLADEEVLARARAAPKVVLEERFSKDTYY
jgi:small-conductance mechanosensitive channel